MLFRSDLARGDLFHALIIPACRLPIVQGIDARAAGKSEIDGLTMVGIRRKEMGRLRSKQDNCLNPSEGGKVSGATVVGDENIRHAV